jgi:hypothetical protein
MPPPLEPAAPKIQVANQLKKLSVGPQDIEPDQMIKHDGYGLIVRRDGPTVRLYSRNAYDWTVRLAAMPSGSRPSASRLTAMGLPPTLLVSSFDRSSARIADPDTDHLYRRSARPGHNLTVCGCESCIDEGRHDDAIEPIGEHQRFLCDAMRAGQQRQGTASFLAETWFSGHWHVRPIAESIASPSADRRSSPAKKAKA